MRDIKRRISSVQSIQQITSAMELVAATKLRRAQQTVETARPYADKLHEVLDRLIAAQQAQAARGRVTTQHPLLQGRTVERVCYVLISGDRGLAGAYNANINRLAEQTLANEERPFELITIGRRGRDYMRRREYSIFKDFQGIGDDVHVIQARDLSRELTQLYTDGTFDEVNFIYTRFLSAGSQRPTVVPLLPLTSFSESGVAVAEVADDGADQDEQTGTEYLYEPSSAAVLDLLLPRHVDMQVYSALLEAKASEHIARMLAMRSATENAGDMIDALTLSFNRARQAAITKEIAEIVGGAEALQLGLSG